MLSTVEMFSALHHSCDCISSFILKVCLPYFLPLQMSSPSGTQTYCNLHIILLLKNADSKYVSQEETLSCARDLSFLFVGFHCILLRFCEDHAPCWSHAHSGGQMESANLREVEQNLTLQFACTKGCAVKALTSLHIPVVWPMALP